MSNYAIIDLEMCQIPKFNAKINLRTEIIQIGATLLNSEYEVVDLFDTFVKPEYGYVNDYIYELTGISNDDLKDAPYVTEAVNKFFEWLPQDTIMVSWSDSDKYQIRKELEIKGIAIDGIDNYLKNWIDCQKIFSNKLKEKRSYSLCEALYMSGIKSEGGEHNGFDDAYNTASLFKKLQLEPDYKLIPIYETLKSDKQERLSYTLGDLMEGLCLN
ncbi:MAG: 3'-5' exonuclease [Eubacteriales bacterium]|nr:3'-5' exonuclease [Eubacteriales bacterium]